jgi:hypothetical protein
MEVRTAHRADASAVNGLLGQLGYHQDGQAATADRIQAWAGEPASAAYVAAAGTTHTRSTGVADTSTRPGPRPVSCVI